MQDNHHALILGASGGLGAALVAQFLADPTITNVFAVSSQVRPDFSAMPEGLKSKLVWITCTYNEVSMAQVADQLTPYQGSLAACVFAMAYCIQIRFGLKNALKISMLMLCMRSFKVIR